MIMKTNICLQAKVDHSLYISPNPQINFFEMKSLMKTRSSMTTQTQTSGGLKYKCHFIIHKMIDTLKDHPVEFDAEIELGTTNLKVYLDGKLKKNISYLDFQFLNGVILFDDINDFKSVTNAVYKDVMSNFKPKIDKYAQKVGVPHFNKFCFFAFRTKFKDEKEKQLGKIYTTITMCLDKQTTDASLDKFSKDFKKNTSEFIFKEPQYGKIQNYRFKQNIEIQYYDPLAKIDDENPEVPDFYTSFTPEGLVLNKDRHYDPNKVKFSFRFDQLVDCIPREAASLKAVISQKLAALYKPDDCCVSYLVDWQMKGVKNMFCSMYDKMYKCKTDIKVFQSTLYEYCIAGKVDSFNRLMKKHDNDLTKAKLYFLEQAAVINFLGEINTQNIEKYENPESKLHADIVKLKKDAKTLRKIALKLFEKDVNANPGPTNPSCKDILNGALERVEKPMGENSDFEKTDRQQSKSDKKTSSTSFTND